MPQRHGRGMNQDVRTALDTAESGVAMTPAALAQPYCRQRPWTSSHSLPPGPDPHAPSAPTYPCPHHAVQHLPEVVACVRALAPRTPSHGLPAAPGTHAPSAPTYSCSSKTPRTHAHPKPTRPRTPRPHSCACSWMNSRPSRWTCSSTRRASATTAARCGGRGTGQTHWLNVLVVHRLLDCRRACCSRM